MRRLGWREVTRLSRSVFDTETRKDDLDFRLYTKTGQIAIGLRKFFVFLCVFLRFVLIFNGMCAIMT